MRVECRMTSESRYVFSCNYDLISLNHIMYMITVCIHLHLFIVLNTQCT